MSDVTQADREAGWLFRPTCYHNGNKEAWMAGVYDGNRGCPNTTFAAHRIAAEKAATEVEHKEAAEIRKTLTHALADERDWTISLLNLLGRAREYVNDALESHEHSDGRALLTEIDEALRPDALYCFTKTRQASKKLETKR